MFQSRFFITTVLIFVIFKVVMTQKVVFHRLRFVFLSDQFFLKSIESDRQTTIVARIVDQSYRVLEQSWQNR